MRDGAISFLLQPNLRDFKKSTRLSTTVAGTHFINSRYNRLPNLEPEYGAKGPNICQCNLHPWKFSFTNWLSIGPHSTDFGFDNLVLPLGILTRFSRGDSAVIHYNWSIANSVIVLHPYVIINAEAWFLYTFESSYRGAVDKVINPAWPILAFVKNHLLTIVCQVVFFRVKKRYNNPLSTVVKN